MPLPTDTQSAPPAPKGKAAQGSDPNPEARLPRTFQKKAGPVSSPQPLSHKNGSSSVPQVKNAPRRGVFLLLTAPASSPPSRMVMVTGKTSQGGQAGRGNPCLSYWLHRVLGFPLPGFGQCSPPAASWGSTEAGIHCTTSPSTGETG